MSNRTPELPTQIVDLIHKYHAEDSCKIHSGSYRALELVKEADPDIPCGLIIAFGAGNYYSLPCADFFSVEHTFVNDNMLANVHMLNKDVYAWTVNEQESVESMEYLTVDGLITDRPTFVYNELHYTDDLLLDFLEHTADDITIHNTDDDEYSDGDY